MLCDAFLDEEIFGVVIPFSGEINSESLGQNICPGSNPN